MRSRIAAPVLLCALVLLGNGCASQPEPPGPAAAGSASISEFSHADLQQGADAGATWNYLAFTPKPRSGRPRNTFNGRLRLVKPSPALGFTLLHDAHNVANDPAYRIRTLPAFDFAFYQTPDGALHPVDRGSLPSGHPYWEFILQPGKVWDEASDGDFSRASIPFALQQKNANCIHNGMLTFLFKESGEISKAAYQIASETCLYLKFDMWGLADADYQPQAIVTATPQVRSSVHFETKPIASLAQVYSGVDLAAFGSPREVSPQHMTIYGFIIDNVHYTSECRTRRGPYPFCRELVVPSYSIAKSVAAGMGLMHLEALYPGVSEEPVSNYVPECAQAPQWEGVSLRHALDMATGNSISSELYADEGAPQKIESFFEITSHAEKIDFACHHFGRRHAPGEHWVYHTSDTYLLGAAMNGFLRSRQSSVTDIYELLVGSLWTRLGMSPVSTVIRRTYDQARQPFMGWGMTLTRDDIARLALFLNLADGKIDERQLLDRQMLDSALQRDPATRGLPAKNPDYKALPGGPEHRYQHGFWARDIGEFLPECAESVWVPYMVGYGGIIIALLPNGSAYYYVSDGDDVSWIEAARASHQIRSLCGGEALAAGAPK